MLGIEKYSQNTLRGLPLSTYALRGRGGVGPNVDVVLRPSKRGCVNLRTRGEGGVQKAEKYAYVFNGSPLSQGTKVTHLPFGFYLILIPFPFAKLPLILLFGARIKGVTQVV